MTKKIEIAGTKLAVEDLLSALDEHGLLLTRDGEPVAKLTPCVEMEQVDFSKYIGVLEGEFEIKGDILSTGERWDAEG